MSENGDEKQQGRRRGTSTEKELASQQVQIQSKRFYIDVKENQRGRFIKLAEVGVGGRKSRILMTMSAAAEFKNHLNEFSEFHSQMGPTHGSAGNTDTNSRENDGLLKSETFVKDRKRYYLDLKENQRGRFLRVSMVVPGPRGGNRAQVAIPAQGLIEFKDQLSDMLERYGSTVDEVPQPELPESKSLRADNKTFYFDCGSNARGVFLKISEVRQTRFRTSITIPEKFLKQFRDTITDYVDKNVNSANVSSDSIKAAGSTANASEKSSSIKVESGEAKTQAVAGSTPAATASSNATSAATK